ncbi:4e649bb4-d863-4f17-9e8d-6e258a16a71e [Sclerotinia trifoliorum]|uniref:4e649bb4-d863-4f17-9e8d-6e258a16a71e n=1 Tax=Sclerotinia trifoliorum TaxID=28548 RepID=A0A8H2ZUA8_9HELO|nr:4e649bb4-d863-4f17-9e8d-6e258a16a71e [Sclerotinia trifoliorum]
MASTTDSGDNNQLSVSSSPHIIFTTPTFTPRFGRRDSITADDGSRIHQRLQRHIHLKSNNDRHIRVQEPEGSQAKSPAASIYMGSYTPRRSRSLAGSRPGSIKSPPTSSPPSPRSSFSFSHTHISQLSDLLQDFNLDLETYGVEELRDGFFDAAFFKPQKTSREELMKDAEFTLPAAFMKKHPLSLKHFFPRQWRGIKGISKQLVTTRAGIKLIKSFLPFFISYVLCLVPVIRNWLGRYNYIMVISAIINHSGRSIGAQIDGTISTIIGTAGGLGWGALALWLSHSTPVARRGYGGILAAFLVVFMGAIAALRSYYIRLYQMVLCAGMAVLYTCLADTSTSLAWRSLFEYGIPWLFGQAIALLVCCTVIPDAGARSLAVSLHNAFDIMQKGLQLPQSEPVTVHRQLAFTFVNLSQAYRDLVLDISITRFKPSDVMALRNLMQAVIRSLLSLRMESHLFEDSDKDEDSDVPLSRAVSALSIRRFNSTSVINIDGPRRPQLYRTDTEDRAVELVAGKLAEPTSNLLSCLKTALQRCDAVLMDMSGHRVFLGPSKDVSSDIVGAITSIRKAKIKYDEEEEQLLRNPNLPPTYSDHPEVVEIFLFVHPIRQAANSAEALLVKVNEMQQRRPGWRAYLPSYPFGKALQRTNEQVRHDRGGVTAGFFFQSQRELAKTMKGMANVYKPGPRKKRGTEEEEDNYDNLEPTESRGAYAEEEEIAMDKNSQTSRQKRLRYKTWKVIHRLQGFETRFALKVAIVTSLLSIPAWLNQSRDWWNKYESWWAVIMVWIMMHPRVGGNIQDLLTRAICALFGAIWGGIAYGADSGNPYVMAVFATIFMIPMMYRFTQSPHPRSGIVGCISFVVVSLGAYTAPDNVSVITVAWTRGVAFMVGTVSAVVVNWFLWPFVARHELRKALSSMLIYSSIIYRGVVAKYVYYEDGEEPGVEDVQQSEMLEGRLREGFVRIRQLLALTRHEIRLRGPFNPLPYSALIAACERFFEYLVSVRQSSLFFHPHYVSENEQASESLLAFRRDAVACILMNLYVLAGALRGDRKVPRYLPSAASARKRLLDHMALLESMNVPTTSSGVSVKSKRSKRRSKRKENNNSNETASNLAGGRKWSQIYSYSYSQSLTGCVTQLEQLCKYTKEIVGEQGFDPILEDEYEDITSDGVGGHGFLNGQITPRTTRG